MTGQNGELSFGEAIIDGSKVSVVELSIAEFVALIRFVPNPGLFQSIVRELAFSGNMPGSAVQSEEESEYLEGLSKPDFIPSEEDQEKIFGIFSKWLDALVPIGSNGLMFKGLVVPNSENSVAVHQVIQNVVTILSSAVEHISYRVFQVGEGQDESAPSLRSSMYALQSMAGDWLVLEHFDGQDYIRSVAVSSATPLSSEIPGWITSGVKQAVESTTYNAGGKKQAPFSVYLRRTNSHGANVVAAAQYANGDWYTPYKQDSPPSLFGGTERRFDNIFSVSSDVFSLSDAPFSQLDIRNGVEGWELVGDSPELVSAVGVFANSTLHSDSDHIPDTIPDDFFN